METPVPQNIEKRIEQYIQLRDAMEQLEERQTAERKPLKELMEQVGAHIHKFLDDNKLQNVKTKAGTANITVRWTTSVADPDGFMKFVIEGKQFDLLERRANSTAVRDYVKEHNSLPTGVNLTSLASVGVRRPTKAKVD